MLEINGYTASAVIYNGQPTTGIYNGTVVWGEQQQSWHRYTASGTLTSWGYNPFGIKNSSASSTNFHYRVSSISPDIPGTWLSYSSCLRPPVGTYFGPGSHLYVNIGFSSTSNRNGKVISANNLHNVHTADSTSNYTYYEGITASLNSGNYPNRTASADIDLSGKYANGSTYSANSGLYSTYSIQYTSNFTTATCKITSSMWSAEFYIQE